MTLADLDSPSSVVASSAAMGNGRHEVNDVVYVVRETASFRDDPAWIDRFGERMILQLPDDMAATPPPRDGA
mgnify:CR=1 FL=1